MSKVRRTTLYLLICGIGLSCGVARRSYEDSSRRSRESSLKLALRDLRRTIKEFSQDQGHLPNKLNDLVTSGYINQIPIDPVTEKADWVPEFREGSTFIKDVHSASHEKSSEGNLYSDW